MDITWPRYDGGSIVNLIAAIAAHFGAPTRHPSLEPPLSLDGAERIVLLIVDGLGFHQLQHHRAHGDVPFLHRQIESGRAAWPAAAALIVQRARSDAAPPRRPRRLDGSRDAGAVGGHAAPAGLTQWSGRSVVLSRSEASLTDRRPGDASFLTVAPHDRIQRPASNPG